MNFKTTTILIFCLLIAGIAVYVVNKQPAVDAPPPAITNLFNLKSSDVNKLVIAPAADKRIVLQRQGVKWRMLEPVAALADAASVDSLVSTLCDLDSHGKSDAGGSNADVTGLNTPRYRVELYTGDGKTTKLAIGKSTGVGDELYVQKEGETRADRVAATLYGSLDKPASSFRDMKLLDVKSPEVKQVAITSGSGSFSMDRQGNNWRITTSATTMPADESGATDLAMALSSLRATEIVAENAEDPRRYGLDDPQVTVNFTSQPTVLPGSTKPSTQPVEPGFLKFGRYQDLRKQSVFAMTSASSAIAVVPVASMTTFDKKPIDLRDKNVLRIDKASVESVVIDISKPATTQPTTRPASQTVATLTRNKEAAKALWHAPFVLPAAGGETTQPATARTATVAANATSMPATLPTTDPSVATTAPTSGPSTTPSTQPAKPAPPKWELTTAAGKSAEHTAKVPADESLVDAMLSQFSPLRAEKFVESAVPAKPVDQYTVTISTASGDYTLHITDAGGSANPVAELDGLRFEVTRTFVDKLIAKFDQPATGEPSPTPVP